jgi:SAM-dependent methyltransferase
MNAPSAPATGTIQETWQLEASGPEAYERYLVPAFFAPCAELVVNAAGIRPGSRLLDVACGTGIVARVAAPRVGRAGRLVGADLNAGMLAVAEALSRDTMPTPRWAQADVVDLPFPDGSFDVLSCQQGLQFFPDWAAAIREMRRVLAPGGRLTLAMWRPLEHNTIFVPFTEALDHHMGATAGDVMRGPFAGPPLAELRAMIHTTGLASVGATAEVVRVRFPSIVEFIRREVQSSPLANPVDELDVRARRAFVADVERRLGPWLDDAGLAFSMETWIVTAAEAPVDAA